VRLLEGSGRTERELSVLRLLATILTVPDIAGELFVSANTIRTHTKHIYRKLDVHRRSEVVDRARDSGLISRRHASG
jgi:DNA-binding NarL/FixJ family response regulator